MFSHRNSLSGFSSRMLLNAISTLFLDPIQLINIAIQKNLHFSHRVCFIHRLVSPNYVHLDLSIRCREAFQIDIQDFQPDSIEFQFLVIHSPDQKPVLAKLSRFLQKYSLTSKFVLVPIPTTTVFKIDGLPKPFFTTAPCTLR